MIDSVNVIILAAGLSRRMGEINKLLLNMNGEPMVRYTASLYRSVFSNVSVVTGFENSETQAALTGLDVKAIFNPAFETGQQSSVRAGLESQSLEGEGVMIALADQPNLTPADISLFTETFLASDKSRVFIPYYQGQRGNPIIFPTAIIREMRASGKSIGCRKFTQNNPDRIFKYETSSFAFVTDLDTPFDALRLRHFNLPDHLRSSVNKSLYNLN